MAVSYHFPFSGASAESNSNFSGGDGAPLSSAKVPTIRGPVLVNYEKTAGKGVVAIEAPMPFTLDLAGVSDAATKVRRLPAGTHRIDI